MSGPTTPSRSRFVAALRDEGGTIAGLIDGRPQPGGASEPARLAAAGPRARGLEAEYELLVEMIFEGCRLHYGPQRVVRTGDRDLALLLGDQLYALGLVRLARIGDLDAVGELADVISLVAQARIAGDPELADAVWTAGAVAISWGTDARLGKAKELARAGEGAAASALRSAAVARRSTSLEETRAAPERGRRSAGGGRP